MPQPLVLRRAEPLDVVNLYRLVTEQGEFDPFDRSDEAGALRYVLDQIADGHVLVAANKAGRLVGALIADGITVKRRLACRVTCFAVAPPYREFLPAELLDLTVRSAQKAGFPVLVPLHLNSHQLLGEAARQAGFKAGAKYWIWDKNKNDQRRNPSRIDGVQPQE